MEIQTSVIVSIVVNLVLIGIAWGQLTSKVNELRSNRTNCMERFKQIENQHNEAIQDIRDDMKAISGSLNQLIGKIDLFFAHYERRS
jgi:seryl-tRNA synthetase